MSTNPVPIPFLARLTPSQTTISMAVVAALDFLATSTKLLEGYGNLTESLQKFPYPARVALYSLIWAALTYLLLPLIFRKSRVSKPEAFDLDPSDPKLLKGRSNELRNIVAECKVTPTVFITGDSGAGKSALALAGLMQLPPESGLLPIYVNEWGEDWSTGARRALANSVNAALEKRKVQHPRVTAANVVDQIGVISKATSQLPLLILDQIDDYIVRHRAELVAGRSQWKDNRTLIAENAFWRDLYKSVENGSCHIVFMARSDVASGLTPFLSPNSASISIASLEATYVQSLLDEIASKEGDVSEPEAGWHQLKARISRDLHSETFVLPIRLLMAIRGLSRLPYGVLTPSAYEAADRFDGLQAVYIKASISRAMHSQPRASASLMPREVDAILRHMIDASQRSTIRRSLRHLAHHIKRKPAEVEPFLHLLEKEKLVKRTTESGNTKWSLYHDAFCGPVLHAINDETVINYRLRVNHEAYSATPFPKSLYYLLGIGSLCALAANWFRGKATLGNHWRYVAASVSFRVAIALAASLCCIYGFMRIRTWNTELLIARVTKRAPSEVASEVRHARVFASTNLPLHTNLVKQALEDASPGTREAMNLSLAMVELNQQGYLPVGIREEAVLGALNAQYGTASLDDLNAFTPVLFDAVNGAFNYTIDIALDESLAPDVRLRAACSVTRNANHRDGRGEDYSRLLSFIASVGSEHIAKSPRDFGAFVSLVRPSAGDIFKHLRTVADNHSIDSDVRLWAGRTFLELAPIQESLGYIVKLEFPYDKEIRTAVERLKNRSDGSQLVSALPGLSPASPSQEANLALIELLLAKDRDSAKSLLKLLRRPSFAIPGPDFTYESIVGGIASTRTYAILRCAQVLPVSELRTLLDNAPGDDQKAAILIAVGLSLQPLDDDLKGKMPRLCRTQDPELRSTCEWLMVGRNCRARYDELITNGKLIVEIDERIRQHGSSGLQSQEGDSVAITTALAVLKMERLGTSHTQDEATSARWYTHRPSGIEFVRLPGGTALLGDAQKEPYEGSQDNLGSVEVSPFDISSTEITVKQFSQFLKTKNKGEYREGKSRVYDLHLNGAASQMSWYQAAEYCNYLSEISGIDRSEWAYLPADGDIYAQGMKIVAEPRRGFRLPTFAEWEYACRAGSKERWSCGDDPRFLDAFSRYWNNSWERPAPVGSMAPNAFGIFDMHGGLSEWCHDVLIASQQRVNGDYEVTDGDKFGTRGGCFYFRSGLVRSGAQREYHPTETFCSFIGFRVVRPRKTK